MKVYTNTKRALRRWLLRTLQPCQEMVPLMSESLERRLDFLEHLNLRLHLLVCTWCARYLKQIKFLGQLVRQEAFPAETDQALPTLNAEARQRTSESLRR